MTEARPVDGEGEGRGVEVRARTVDEAVARGLVRLGGLSRSEVKIEVIHEGRSGLLGFGAEEAVVRLTALRPGEQVERAARPVDASPTRPPNDRPAEPPPQPPQVRAPETPHAKPARRDRPTPADQATAQAEAVVSPAANAPTVERAARAPRRPPRAAPAAEDRDTPARPPVPADEGDDEAVIAEAQALTEQVLELLGYEGVSIERSTSLLPAAIDDDQSVVLTIRGQGVDRLLVDEARPLLALQFLVRMAASRRTDRWVNLLLDVDGDRARRIQELFDLAEQSAELVEREGLAVSLPPMTPYDRRVVHLALREHPTVATQSIGTGEYRKVTVRLKGQLLPDV
jgi:spoIIIJ-associated protein